FQIINGGAQVRGIGGKFGRTGVELRFDDGHGVNPIGIVAAYRMRTKFSDPRKRNRPLARPIRLRFCSERSVTAVVVLLRFRSGGRSGALRGGLHVRCALCGGGGGVLRACSGGLTGSSGALRGSGGATHVAGLGLLGGLRRLAGGLLRGGGSVLRLLRGGGGSFLRLGGGVSGLLGAVAAGAEGQGESGGDECVLEFHECLPIENFEWLE